MEGFPNQQNGATRQEIYAYRLGRRQAMGVAQEREARRGQVGAREELREHRQMARHRARQPGGYFITFELAAPLVNDPPSHHHGRRHLHHVAAISSVILLNRHLRHAVIPPMKNRRARACPCVLLV